MCSIQVEWLQESAGAHPVAPSHTFSSSLVNLPGTGSDQSSFVPAKQCIFISYLMSNGI